MQGKEKKLKEFKDDLEQEKSKESGSERERAG